MISVQVQKWSSYSIPLPLPPLLPLPLSLSLCLSVELPCVCDERKRNYTSFHSLMITAQVDNLGLCVVATGEFQHS